MKMSRCLSASILLMLSLEAFLLVAGVDDTIRLPSDTQVAAKRPWKCCDTIRCTRSFPPTCSCLDKLDRCPAGCKSCAVSTRGLFVCNDQFRGDPGPICRPWKCCDAQPCTKIAPPADCRCGDEVDKCDAKCKKCVPSTTNPSRFVCKDVHRGDIAPRCRPWKCCDFATCTKSIPPICQCRDEVEECADTCIQCAMSTSDPSRNVCNDQFRGAPGPKCPPEDVVIAGGNYSTTGGRV